ncbi:MAG: apolipoprotein N-acyltransferase [Puniceicoccales bacterium]|nr:apolipoprotein N-acyltransferase [Puniceicoccales bacterium]
MLFFGNSYRALRLLPWAVCTVAGALYCSAIMATALSETVWFWAVPLLCWFALARPHWRTWLPPVAVALFLAKAVSLVWLRHVEWPLGLLGVVLLSAYLALFPLAWAAFARWLFPRMGGASLVPRLVAQMGIAGAWVVLEWAQGWLLSGFPWMLLADTQWQRPASLALCAWGGPWLLSFCIVLLNTGLARYVMRFFEERERAEQEALLARRASFERAMNGVNAAAGADDSFTGGAARPDALRPLSPMGGLLGALRRVCPEFYLGMVPVFLGIFSFYQNFREHSANAETLCVAGVVQTDFDPYEKWKPERGEALLATVASLTREAASLPVKPDLLLWPEAALPFRAGTANYDAFLRARAADAGAALLAGGIIGAPESPLKNAYYNAVIPVSPETGAETAAGAFYAKRHLVPFGEYIPAWARFLGVDKLVPDGGNNLPGERAAPLPVTVRRGAFARALRVGALVCYEDVFPEYGREAVLAGADFLAVLTNDAWYGREAGAYQHAAHSAVLAASFGVPVARCGNAGWSGVFNALGQASPVLAKHAHPAGGTAAGAAGAGADGETIYFRGTGSFDVRGVPAARRKPTFYTQRGDWAVTFSALLALWASARNFPRRPRNGGRRRKKEASGEDAIQSTGGGLGAGAS